MCEVKEFHNYLIFFKKVKKKKKKKRTRQDENKIHNILGTNILSFDIF